MKKKGFKDFLVNLNFTESDIEVIENNLISSWKFNYFYVALKFTPYTLYAYVEDRKRHIKHLYYLVFFLQAAYRKYLLLKHKIGKSAAINQFSDIANIAKTFKKQNGSLGINRIEFVKDLVVLNIRQFGPLQFQKVKLTKEISYFEKKYEQGSKCINIMIPNELDLNFKEAEDALNKAKNHYKKFDLFVCSSWLLCPNLQTILDFNHDYIKFQNLFYVYATNDFSLKGEICIFDSPKIDSKEYQEDTQMQKDVKSMLLRGLKLSEDRGILK